MHSYRGQEGVNYYIEMEKNTGTDRNTKELLETGRRRGREHKRLLWTLIQIVVALSKKY